jgi:hypothetical protein
VCQTQTPFSQSTTAALSGERPCTYTHVCNKHKCCYVSILILLSLFWNEKKNVGHYFLSNLRTLSSSQEPQPTDCPNPTSQECSPRLFNLLRSTIILYSHKRLGHPSDPFLWIFQWKHCKNFPYLPFVLHSPPIPSFLIWTPVTTVMNTQKHLKGKEEHNLPLQCIKIAV